MNAGRKRRSVYSMTIQAHRANREARIKAAQDGVRRKRQVPSSNVMLVCTCNPSFHIHHWLLLIETRIVLILEVLATLSPAIFSDWLKRVSSFPWILSLMDDSLVLMSVCNVFLLAAYVRMCGLHIVLILLHIPYVHTLYVQFHFYCRPETEHLNWLQVSQCLLRVSSKEVMIRIRKITLPLWVQMLCGSQLMALHLFQASIELEPQMAMDEGGPLLIHAIIWPIIGGVIIFILLVILLYFVSVLPLVYIVCRSHTWDLTPLFL